MTTSSRFSAVHPQFQAALPTFVLLRDSFKGERQIKSKRTLYLPYTAGQVEFGAGESTAKKSEGDVLYDAYLKRAVFHGDFKRTVRALMGLIHREEPVINLPTALEDMRENATNQGESLSQFLRRINEEQFITGRFGVQLDVDRSRPLPYMVGWQAEHIRNWNETNDFRDMEIVKALKWVLLDETRFEPNENLQDNPTSSYDWTPVEAFRRLSLNQGGRYVTEVERDGTLLGENVISLQGRTLEEIPFWIANAVDTVRDVAEAPLEDLANLLLAVYRGEADYRETLHRIGQDTLVIIGAPMPEDESGKPTDRLVGSHAVIELPLDGDAKYIGVSGDGLSEQREAITNDRQEAGQYGSQLFDSERGAETGEALTMRASGRTASLVSIVKTGALTLENALKTCAVWVGANPDEVEVKPNLDFLNSEMTAEELASLMGSKVMGAPISMQTIHERMQKRGMTEQEYEDELALIQAEVADGTFDAAAMRGDDVGEDDEGDEDEGSSDDDE